MTDNLDLDLTLEDEVTMTDTEAKASDRGWKPEAEWEGEADQWVAAGEFLRNGELMDTISTLNKREKANIDRIGRLENGLKALGDHNKNMAEVEYNKAIKSLKQQKADAMDMADHTSVVEIEEQMSELKETHKEIQESEPEPQAQPAQPNPVMVAWAQENTWYNTNPALRGAADNIARAYMQDHPEMQGNPQAVLNHVDTQIKAELPEKFNTRRRAASTVESGEPGATSKARTGSTKFSARSLNEMQRDIGKTLVAEGCFANMQEYVNQLAETGELV